MQINTVLLKNLKLSDISSQLAKRLENEFSQDIKQVVGEIRASAGNTNTDYIIKNGSAAKPLITVIIPSYNTSDYVIQCLDSVKDQTLSEIEVIIVDDASSDDTLTKIYDAAKDDQRVSILALGAQTGSPGHARNLGVALASAPYIAFVDSDDWLETGMLENLYHSAQTHEAEIVFLSGFTNHLNGTTTTRYYKKSYIDGDSPLKGFHESFMLWDKLWNLEFLKKNNLKVGHTSASEELLFILKAYYYAQKTAVATGNYGYNYRRLNPTSITRNIRRNVYPDYEFDAWRQVDAWVSTLPINAPYRIVVSVRKLLSFQYAVSIAHETHLERFCLETNAYLAVDFNDKTNALAHQLGYGNLVNSFKGELAQPIAKRSPGPKAGNILYGPDWSSSNPYQRLMYQSIRKAYGIHATGFSPKQLTKDYLYTKRSSAHVLHLHWLHAFYDGDSEDSVGKFIEAVKFAKELGYMIMWTAHNLMPHDSSPDNEANHLRVRKSIIELADHIHVHDIRTEQALKAKFEISTNKIFVASHGLYERQLSNSNKLRKHVRSVVGLPEGRFTVLLAGRIRAYKGIERALDIFTTGKCRLFETATLLVVGCPDDEAIDGMLVEAAKRHEHIKYIRGDVSDLDLEALFLAADISLLPYEKSATSGLAFLSASYQKPMITSKLAAFTDFVDRGLAICGKSTQEIEEAIQYAAYAHAEGTLDKLFRDVTGDSIQDLTWDSIVTSPAFSRIFKDNIVRN